MEYHNVETTETIVILYFHFDTNQIASSISLDKELILFSW